MLVQDAEGVAGAALCGYFCMVMLCHVVEGDMAARTVNDASRSAERDGVLDFRADTCVAGVAGGRAGRMLQDHPFRMACGTVCRGNHSIVLFQVVGRSVAVATGDDGAPLAEGDCLFYDGDCA